MALNKFMHPRNRYKNNRPDFAKLGDRYPDFQSFLTYNDKGKATLDFKDPEALRALTCTLLKDDFDLDLDVPLDHIIPTVPLRLNYIHWLEDLLKGISNTDVWGIDIGCGTSCIYPLLGARINSWNFLALEVDPLALQYAKDNVNRNQLNGQIQVLENITDSLFMDFIKGASSSCPSKFHFTMCNPPFFGNVLEAQGMLTSRSYKRSEPSSVSTADEVEMIVEGGEVDFVRRMIQESKEVSNRVVWFTSMLGKKSSVGQIVAELKREKVPTWTTTEFCQGRTMRWGVAWSYAREAKKQQTPTKMNSKVKPPLSVPVLSEYITKLFQKVQTDSTTTQTDSATTVSKQRTQGRGRQEKVQAVAKAMEQLMKSLEMTVTKQNSTKWNPRFDLVANKNTWSHQRRKRRQAKMKKKHRDREDEDERRGPYMTPDEKLCNDELPVTIDMKNSRLKSYQDCSESAPSQVKPKSFSPLCSENCVKLPTGGSDSSQYRNKSELAEDMQTEENAEDNGYHGNHVSVISNGEKEADESKIEELCSEKLTNGKDGLNPKRVKWKLDEGSEISDSEPARKRKKLMHDGLQCFEYNNSTGQKENGANLCDWSLENASPAELQVQGKTCQNQSETRSMYDSAGGDSFSVQSKFCKNEEIPKQSEEKMDGVLKSHSMNEHVNQRNEATPSVSSDVDIKSSPAMVTKGAANFFSRQEGIVSHLTQGASSSGHVHTPICMSSSDPGSSSDVEQSGPLLKCLMEVKLVTKGSVEVVFSCDPGQNRELLHQVAQYVKNHITRESKV